MTPTETLKHEHRIILMVLDAAEREARRIQAGGAVDTEKIEKMLDFIRNFADRCHHAKEEDLLFVRMGQRGMPTDSGPIAVMLYEHNEGRARVRAVADALPQAAQGNAAAIATVTANLLAYTQLLRAHIDKEDNILYPMADRLLTPADQRTLAEAFERVEAEEMGAGVHERYHHLAHELAGHGG
ncbi:MAG: hemerythrin domain-containing protein [Anaerolineae bacterium]|nr:hemerythrin domain-containing protein [Anaerolineae bacterium]